MNRTLVWFLLVGYVPMIVATVLFGLQAIKYSTAWGYFAVGAVILFASFVAAGAWLWCFASIALFLWCLRKSAAAQLEENLTATATRSLLMNPHDPNVPGFFTGLGSHIFVAAQCAKAVTAAFVLAMLWDQINVPVWGWIYGIERSSGLLPSALACIVVATLTVLGSAARPNGPGTGKWYSNDAIWTLVIGGVLVVGFVGWIWKTETPVTGLKLDVLILTLGLFVAMILAWFTASRLTFHQVLATPRMPDPVIDSFSANLTSVAVGGTIVLNWATSYATEVDISGHGVAGAQGPMSYRPAGAAGDTVTITLTARGAAGTTPATRSIDVTLT